MRRTILVAVLAAALPAAAQDPAALPQPPSGDAAPAAPGRWKSWELSVLGWGGAYSGGAAESGAGGFDATVMFRGDLLAVGARAGSEKVGAGFGSSLAAVGGLMAPLSPRVRLDVLADAGFGLQMVLPDGEGSGCGPGSFCDGRDGATVIRPEVGARAGLAFLTADGRLSLHLGAFARLVPEERIALERRTCVFSSCTSATEHRTVGGKAFGAYLGLGFPRRL